MTQNHPGEEFTNETQKAQQTADAINALVGRQVATVNAYANETEARVEIEIDDAVMQQYGATNSDQLLSILRSKQEQL